VGFLFGKTYRVKCPDGSHKWVHRNVDDAFPLYIKGYQGDVNAELTGLSEVSASAGATYATKIQGLLFGLDELNQGLMIHFRGVYLVYMSDPCGNAPFLQREVQKLLGEQQRLVRLRIQIRALIELARNHPEDTNSIVDHFQKIAGSMGGPALAEASRAEITEARKIAGEWAGEK
jgi:hypothetical protein